MCITEFSEKAVQARDNLVRIDKMVKKIDKYFKDDDTVMVVAGLMKLKEKYEHLFEYYNNLATEEAECIAEVF